MDLRVLGCGHVITEKSQQRQKLILAWHAVDQLLWQWQADPLRWQSLLRQIFDRSTPVDLSCITIEILDGDTMAGLHGAYAPISHDGDERIYLNASWLELANPDQIEAVLLEELGHAIDHRLNGSSDTPGDEGAIFSALIRDVPIPVVETTHSDHHTLIINEKEFQIHICHSNTTNKIASVS